MTTTSTNPDSEGMKFSLLILAFALSFLYFLSFSCNEAEPQVEQQDLREYNDSLLDAVLVRLDSQERQEQNIATQMKIERDFDTLKKQ